MIPQNYDKTGCCHIPLGERDKVPQWVVFFLLLDETVCYPADQPKGVSRSGQRNIRLLVRTPQGVRDGEDSPEGQSILV